jgi:hypothetical protein
LLPAVVNGDVPKTEPAYVLPTYFLYTWAFIAYFDTRPECKAYFQNEYPDMWDMLEVYVWYFVLMMSCTVVFGCCGFMTKKEVEQPALPVQVEGVPGMAGPRVGELPPV